MIHKTILSLGRLVDALRPPASSRARTRPNPWLRCPSCRHRVPVICMHVDEDGHLCDRGKACGCCQGHAEDDREEAVA